MKKFLVVASILICMICAGCFQGKFDLIITDEGAVVRNWTVMGTAPFSRKIEEIKANNEKVFPNLRVKPVVEGEMLGYDFSLDYPDIETFAKEAHEKYIVHTGRNKGFSQRKGWFFDAYDFDFYVVYAPLNLPPEVGHLTQAAFDSVVYDVTFQLPYSADKHNADKFDAANKVLTWNLAPVLIHGGERYINARFKIWHKDKIALTTAVEILLLAATIFFFRKAHVEESESLGKDFRFKRNVFAGLFLALAIISAYMLLAPVNFTDADIISAAAP